MQEAKRELAGLDGEDGEDMQGQESAVETPARLEVFTETPTPIKNIDPIRFSGFASPDAETLAATPEKVKNFLEQVATSQTMLEIDEIEDDELQALFSHMQVAEDPYEISTESWAKQLHGRPLVLACLRSMKFNWPR